jgi:hypothetical protein
VFAYYYLWWSTAHWLDRLGPEYPYRTHPLPLPARVNSSGCFPVPRYRGAQLMDVPDRITSQDDPSTILADVRAAASARLSGFVVNWRGTGRPGQTERSISYNRRLQNVVEAVHAVNAAGTPFSLWISYKASDSQLPQSYIENDLEYLARTYGNDPAFDHTYGGRPILVWMGSRKYASAVLAAVSARFRDSFFLVGDENWRSWPRHGRYFDGDQYYWSSQNPYSNPHSFDQLRQLANEVRAPGADSGSRKRWFSPIAPGFDRGLLTGSTTCVPRRNGQTLRRLFEGNAATHPDAYVLISWNEIAEGTYVQPLRRWGTRYLDVLRSLITAH